MRKRSIVCSLVCMLMLSLNVSVLQSAWVALAGQNTVTANNQSSWTVMAYLDGDNELEGYAIAKFLSMSQVGSSSDVKLLAQLDRTPGSVGYGYDTRYGDWTDTKRFVITQGMTPTPENAVRDLGEQNTGDPNTLTLFIQWAVENYPADHYFLVLFDHGEGAVGVHGQDASPDVAPPVGLMFDYTAGDFLTTPELGQALGAAGVKIDIVFIDGCYMAGLEVAYQIAAYADVMVGYEGDGHGAWTDLVYHNFLASLVSNPSMSSTDIGVRVVDEYASIWSRDSYRVTCSAIDLTKLRSTGIVTATDNFARELMALYTKYFSQIQSARSGTEDYGGYPAYQKYGDPYADLYHFADQIYNLVPDGGLRKAASEVKSNLDATVISSRQYNYPNAHGLSVYFPENRSEYHRAGYLNCSFTIDTNWDEWLGAYYITSRYAAEIGSVTVVPDPASQGSRVTFSIPVQNTGRKELEPVRVDLELCQPNGDLASSPSSTVTYIAIGSVSVVQIYYDLGALAPIGTWTFDVQVYRKMNLLDSQTGLKFTVKPLVISGRILSVSVNPNPVTRGGTTTFTVKIENTGESVWSTASITLIVYKPNAKVAGKLTISPDSIKPGIEYTFTRKYYVQASAPTGTYHYDVILTYGSTTIATITGNEITVN